LLRFFLLDLQAQDYHGARRMTMCQYVFLCLDCDKEFTKDLHMAELEKGGIVCPHCGSKKVKQKVTEFTALTSKKS